MAALNSRGDLIPWVQLPHDDMWSSLWKSVERAACREKARKRNLQTEASKRATTFKLPTQRPLAREKRSPFQESPSVVVSKTYQDKDTKNTPSSCCQQEAKKQTNEEGTRESAPRTQKAPKFKNQMYEAGFKQISLLS